MAAAMLAASALPAFANCVGTDTFQTCYDLQSGNSYNTQRLGTSSYTQGMNARTGSNWSMQTHQFGSTTMTTGTDKEGRPFSRTCTGNICY
jgi:hypothetical protein